MARLRHEIPPPQRSVLDRLLDDDPDNQACEGVADYHAALADLKGSVLRDLNWLLNARLGSRRTDQLVAKKKQDPLAGTVARLGLPDITNLDLKNDREREQLRRCIFETIATFEPRLDFVTVSVGDGGESRGQTRFHIEARLRVDPEPLRLSFDATVVWRNRTVEIR